jgi:Family of unknown function (DUF6339)
MASLKVFKHKSLVDLYMFLKTVEFKKLEVLFHNQGNWVQCWFNEHFKGEEWFFDSKLSYKIASLNPEAKFDLDNAISLHSALPLTRVQAADERLWVYLSLVTYWDYTFRRWNIDFNLDKESSQRTTVLTRYAMLLDSQSDRPLLRNAISRLWWVTEMTIDYNRKDKYELTKIILSNTDVYQQVMERSFSRNEVVIRAILELFSELGEEVYLKKRFYRNILKEFNAIGGVVMLDLLTKEELKEYVRNNLGI